MKSVLVFIISFFLLCSCITCMKAENRFTSFEAFPFFEIVQDTAKQLVQPTLSSSTDMVLQNPPSRATDHPLTLGETARDFGGAFEHLAPLIFMVISFLITMIAGSFLWERGYIWDKLQVPPPLEPRNRIPWATTILAALFSLVTALLLLNVIGNYMANVPHVEDNDTNMWDSHHLPEILLSLAAFALLLAVVLFLQRFSYAKMFIISFEVLLYLFVILIVFKF